MALKMGRQIYRGLVLNWGGVTCGNSYLLWHSLNILIQVKFILVPCILLNTTLTLIWVGEWGVILPPPCCNPCILQHSVHFIRDVRAKFDIPYSPKSPDIGQNSDGVFPISRISGQSLIKGNYNNSRTSHDIDMKLGPVTKLDKRNKTTLKKFAYDIMLENLTSLPFFQFTDNLEQSGSRILDT